MNLIIIIYRNEVFIIFIYFYISVERMLKPTSKKVNLRNYREDFVVFHLVSVDSKPMCLECGAILTNDSTKKLSWCITRNQSIHHLLVKIGNYLRIKEKAASRTIRLYTEDEYEKTKTPKRGYHVSEIIAKVAEPPTYGEKLVKPAMIACVNEVLGKDSASTLCTIPLSNGTITRRQDQLSNFVEEKMVEIQQKTKFSIQVDESTIHNQAIWSMLDSSMKMI